MFVIRIVLNGTVRGSLWLCLPVISALQKQDQCKLKVTCETLCHKTREGANTSLSVVFFTKLGFHPSLSMSSLNSHSTLGMHGVQTDCVLKIRTMNGLFAILNVQESLGLNLSSDPKLLCPLFAVTRSVNMEAFMEGVTWSGLVSG